jgi:hypothetical protein
MHVFQFVLIQFVEHLCQTYIPRSMRPSDSRARPSFWHDLAFGLRYIRQRPPFVFLPGLFTITMFLLPGAGYSLVTPLVLSFETGKLNTVSTIVHDGLAI